MNKSDYELYRKHCISAGYPPLTKREWKLEGELTFSESKLKSDNFQQRKHDEWARKTGWI